MSEGVVDIVAVPRIERRVIFGRSAVRACVLCAYDCYPLRI